MKKLIQDYFIYSMKPENKIALWLDDGEVIEIETNNWFSSGRDYAYELANAIDGIDINPATRPVGVRGAVKGDILKIDILEIDLIDKGMMFSFPGSGILGKEIEKIETKVIPMKDGYAHFTEHIKIPLKPMIGVIGTCPEKEIPCYIPGSHGGNMDTRHIQAGSSIYLPVYVDGGGFAVGDLHGVMGDGEISEWGLETSGTVKLRVNLIKQKQLEWPLLETETDYYFIISNESLDEALKTAVSYAVDLVRESAGLSMEEAISLISLIGNLEISQIVNPVKTVRMRISKEVCGLDLGVWNENNS